MKIQFTLASKNSKLGNMPAAMVESKSCPNSCPLKSGGCYAKSGHVRFWWDKLDRSRKAKHSWGNFIKQVKALFPKQIWRMSVAGDLPGVGDHIDKRKMLELINANKGRGGFGYSHKPVLSNSKQSKHNRELIRLANKKGFVVNLSGNDLANADDLFNLKIGPVVSIVPLGHPKHSFTPNGVPVLVCPQQTIGLTCDRCKLCAKSDRKFIVGFISHGVSKNKVSARATLPIVG